MYSLGLVVVVHVDVVGFAVAPSIVVAEDCGVAAAAAIVVGSPSPPLSHLFLCS